MNEPRSEAGVRLDADGRLSERPRLRVGFAQTQRRRCRAEHFIRCPYCGDGFNLFAAVWCAHQDGEGSKLCPSCGRCVCEHPAYAEPHFWKDAPDIFQQYGFRRLFLFYL
jgi:hypothetical protein